MYPSSVRNETTGIGILASSQYLDGEHVEVDLILPKRGHSLTLEAIVREPRELEGAQHFGLDEK